jgi:hypothetical protein
MANAWKINVPKRQPAGRRANVPIYLSHRTRPLTLHSSNTSFRYSHLTNDLHGKT